METGEIGGELEVCAGDGVDLENCELRTVN